MKLLYCVIHSVKQVRLNKAAKCGFVFGKFMRIVPTIDKFFDIMDENAKNDCIIDYGCSWLGLDG